MSHLRRLKDSLHVGPSCWKKKLSSKWNWPPDSRYPVLPRERSTCCNMQCQLSAICSTFAAIDGGFNTWIPIFRQIFKDQRVFQEVWGILASSKWAGISKELHLGSWFLFHDRMPRWDLVHLASAHLIHRFSSQMWRKDVQRYQFMTKPGFISLIQFLPHCTFHLTKAHTTQLSNPWALRPQPISGRYVWDVTIGAMANAPIPPWN